VAAGAVEAGLAWLRSAPPGRWAVEAACADVRLDEAVRDTFTADVLDEAAGAAVAAVCASCPVRVSCGSYGRQARCWGVWGGTLLGDGRERVPARRARASLEDTG